LKNLLLTLGHNSSAILIEDGKLIWGYETERLTGVKSDSRFPEAVLKHKDVKGVDMVYATHWAPTGRLSDVGRKYWVPETFDGVPVRSLDFERTHHDTHMAAAMCYAGDEFRTRKNVYGLVIDGFGTLGEHLSIYKFVHGSPVLLKRVHGYETSLGLWYQYATAFMGMKMHEDEYKLLGYEVHCPMNIADKVDRAADTHAYKWLDAMGESVYGSAYDPLYDVSALDNIRAKHFQHLGTVCDAFSIQDPTSQAGRAILAKYVQRVLETVVLELVDDLPDMDHLLCSGGVFLNVKLNRKLIDTVKGQLCVYPLAGDQGNALGLYYMDNPTFVMPDGLDWGQRSLESKGSVRGLHHMNEQSAKEFVVGMLRQRGYVNIVRGGMEFGPRALCRTSTLALPHPDIVQRINAANNRNTVMPMAPVMTGDMYRTLFKDTEKVWRSEEHMIVAMQYRDTPPEQLRGIAHRYGTPTLHYTGRPQVIDQRDQFMVDVLEHFGHPLINTSFNFHGQPIAFDTPQVILNHNLQYQRDDTFETVIIPN
jgi:carbamoyltransferase